jgi:hypothetical protein
MPSAKEHASKVREWLRRHAAGFDPGDGVTAYQYALAECVEAIKALKATQGVADGKLTQWANEIVTQEKCSVPVETIVARVEDYIP